MTRTLKSWLLKILGPSRYLSLTSSLFFIYFNNGWLKNNPSYFAHYLAGSFIQPGQTVIDIGANLGYYSRIFAQRVGESGKVLSVEPIDLYRKVLEKNLEGLKQVTILPFALGEKEGIIKMGNPSTDKHRHGLMRVLSENETDENSYEVPVKNPMVLFQHLQKLDYIKCDIEGYEVPVIPAMRPILEQLRPVVQVETEGENKMVIMELFRDMNYQTFYAGKNKLLPYPDGRLPSSGDLIAIPAEKLASFSPWLYHG